jgi:hypothetical protein
MHTSALIKPITCHMPAQLPGRLKQKEWLRLCEAVEASHYMFSSSTIKRLGQKNVIRTKEPYKGGNLLYNAEDVMKLVQ